MPTTYTHDKFGKDVYKKLPEHIKAVIRKGKGVYRIGQHGPDIFFYYKPICLPQSRINKIGPQMHKEPAFGFFQCLSAYVYGQRAGPCSLQRSGKTGTEKRILQPEGICQRRNAQCVKKKRRYYLSG